MIRAQITAERGINSVTGIHTLVRCAGSHEPRWMIPTQTSESAAWVWPTEIDADTVEIIHKAGQ